MKRIRVQLAFRIFDQERGEIFHGGAGKILIQCRHGLFVEDLFP